MSESTGPTCELCYRKCSIFPGGKVPECWEQMYESWVCPECVEAVSKQGLLLPFTDSGRYASKKRDRRKGRRLAELEAR